MSTSIASAIVIEAAEKVNIDPSETLQKLEREYIKEEWQLAYLDSQQWHVLDVPMGLVTAIRKSLDDRRGNLDFYQQAALSSNSSYHSPAPMKKRMIKSNPSIIFSDEDEVCNSNSLLTSPTLSTTSHSTASSLYRPPVMPKRKVSQRTDSNDEVDREVEVSLRRNPQDLAAAPPVLPQRLESIEQERGMNW